MSKPVIVNEFLDLVRHGRVDNTYKMVWAKAILDLAIEDPNRTTILLDDISEKVISYYWNLHIFFDPEGRTLQQGSNSSKPPAVLQYVLGLISDYKLAHIAYKPCFYEKLSKSDRKQLSVQPELISSMLRKDVRHRFLNLNDNTFNIYNFEKDDDNLIFSSGFCEQLCDYQDVLHESILFRWTQILEDFNRSTPRIAAKVKIKQGLGRKGGSLKKFHSWLLLENPNKTCSVCDTPISNDKDLSVDHVIPWSFLYSDDIWNLSFIHKTCNSHKSNTPPSQKAVKAQEERNNRLYHLISLNHEELMNNKIFKELDFAINENLLRKMWAIYRV